VINRVLVIRIVAALAPASVVWMLWMASGPGDGLPDGRIAQLTHTRAFKGQPAVSPNGTQIAYRCDYEGNTDICVTSLDGGAARNLTSDSRDDEGEPAFSPDGRTIAFRSGSRGIFTVPAGGGPFTFVAAGGTEPAWTPDGRWIVFSKVVLQGAVFREGITEGYSIELSTHTTRRLPLIVDFHQPAVSPHGHRVAYVGRPTPVMRQGLSVPSTSRTDVWTVSLDGRPPQRVTDDGSVERSPMWSADGRHLYYVSDRNGSSAIWRVAIDEHSGRARGKPESLSTPYSQPVRIARSADGRRLVWADERRVDRLMRVAFDAEARTTRGAPTEIAPGSREWEDPEPPGEPSLPPSVLAFPGRWSPDRSLFAGSNAGAVWIYSAASREHYQLRSGKSPVWLTDSRRLIYASDGRLYIAEAVVKVARELLVLAGQNLDAPRLSSDNRRLYFSAEGIDANLWLLTVDR
jgi:dipeptidyl aminopeptidase/acylaminoacyl peptidase